MRSDAISNRQAILKAARELFAKDGVAVGMDSIAERSGLATGTLYRHFPSKDALIDAVIEANIAALSSEADTLAHADDAVGAFFELLKRMLDRGLSDKTLKSALPDRKWSSAPIFRSLEVLLVRAQASGHVDPDLSISELLALIAGFFRAHESLGASASRARLFAVLRRGLIDH